LSEGGGRLLEAYFFPPNIKNEPFGTAVVHFRRLPGLNFEHSRLGTHVNVPFNGHVENDELNAVAGDLKWSSNNSTFYLTASFLRHVMAVILADAIGSGVDPRHLSITWSYPRAFSDTQVNNLRNLWQSVLDVFADKGLALPRPSERDESLAVLYHFFNAAQANPAGRPTVIIDVGGATADIAVYGEARTHVLDSVMLGGRNLTGRREQGTSAEQLANPFVRAFVRWAEAHQLDQYPVEAAAVAKYLADKQDHLAFSYLLGTRWFRTNGHRFSGETVFHRFQGIVLYFYGALFHYVGLAMRELTGRLMREQAMVPYTVTLAGNGSRYMDWLSDISRMPVDSPFKSILGNVLLRAAGAADEAPRPKIQLSETPKHEVALGLVAAVPVELHDAASQTPLIGEAVSVSLCGGAREATLTAAERLGEGDQIEAGDVAALRWTGEELEIGRFHDSLLGEAGTMRARGPQWPKTVTWLQEQLRGMSPHDLQEAAKGRLFYLASANQGFRSSLFVLEAATVLDHLLQDLGGVAAGQGAVGARAGGGTPTAGGSR
jgi:hypothetical protein